MLKKNCLKASQKLVVILEKNSNEIEIKKSIKLNNLKPINLDLESDLSTDINLGICLNLTDKTDINSTVITRTNTCLALMSKTNSTEKKQNHLDKYLKGMIWIVSLLLVMNKGECLNKVSKNPIQGSDPYLVLMDGNKEIKLNNGDELLGFTMPKRDGGEGRELIDASMSGQSLDIPAGMKLRDVVAAVRADGKTYNLRSATDSVNIKVVDDDGDAETGGSLSGSLKITWYHEGKALVASDLDEKFKDCGNSYELRVEKVSGSYNDIVATTRYGRPNRMVYENSYRREVKYTFEPRGRRICYIEPYSVDVFSGKDPSLIKYSKGYNEAVWIKGGGFKVDSGFPTTGFKGAGFRLVGPGSKTKYRCSSVDDGGKITLSDNNHCSVTYNSRTKAEFTAGGTPTIKMEYHEVEGEWRELGSYHIPTPAKWVITARSLRYVGGDRLDNFDVLDKCRNNERPKTTVQQGRGLNAQDKEFRQKYLYRREEFTNNPKANPNTFAEGSRYDNSFFGGYYSRDVDGTFMGEWGTLGNYKSSDFKGEYPTFNQEWYTAELFLTGNTSYGVFGIDGSDGRISRPSTNWFNVAACRGD